MDLLERQPRFVSRGEPAPRILCDLERQAVSGLFLAQTREENVIVAAAEDDELFALIRSKELNSHESTPSSINLASMTDGQDKKFVVGLIEDDTVISIPHPHGRRSGHTLHITASRGPLSIKGGDQTLLNRLRKLRECSTGGRREDQRLSHISIITEEVHLRNEGRQGRDDAWRTGRSS